MKTQFRGKMYFKGKEIDINKPLCEGYFFSNYIDATENVWLFINIRSNLLVYPSQWEESYTYLEDKGMKNIVTFEDMVEMDGYFGVDHENYTTRYYEAIKLKDTLNKL